MRTDFRVNFGEKEDVLSGDGVLYHGRMTASSSPDLFALVLLAVAAPSPPVGKEAA